MIETVLQGVGSATFFASRAFLPAFVTGVLLRFGPSLPFVGDTELIQQLPGGAPHWFTSGWMLTLLGVELEVGGGVQQMLEVLGLDRARRKLIVQRVRSLFSHMLALLPR